MMFLGVVLSKPMLFVLLAAVFVVINVSAKGSVADDGKLESLGQLALIAVCFVMIGLAPFALLKWSPILPTAADSADFGSSGSASGEMIGSSASMYQQQAGGGSGGGGDGGGAASRNADVATSPGRGTGPSDHLGGHNSSPPDASSASSDHASSRSGHGGQTSSGSVGIGGKDSGKGGAKAGSAESKLMSAAKTTAGAAAGAATVAAPFAVAAAGAAMNKAGGASAQNAPEHADGEH